jgi:hypothetical protein
MVMIVTLDLADGSKDALLLLGIPKSAQPLCLGCLLSLLLGKVLLRFSTQG